MKYKRKLYQIKLIHVYPKLEIELLSLFIKGTFEPNNLLVETSKHFPGFVVIVVRIKTISYKR